MTADRFTQMLVTAIRAIPGDDESPAPVDDLCLRAGFQPDAAALAGLLLTRLLESFGVLRKIEDDESSPLVKADSPAALMFLRSFAEHLADGRVLLENWSRLGTADPPYSEHEVLSGPQFLYLLERRRLGADPHASALRRTDVAQVLISTRSRSGGTTCLVLWDAAARQYQLPGGHRRRGDGNLHEVAVRELQEELPNFTFDPLRDQLVELGAVRTTQVSRTYGVATAYTITFFHLRSTRTSLGGGPQARWISESTLLTPRATVAGQTLNLVGLHRLHQGLPRGVPGLGASFDAKQPCRWWIATAQANPLEFWGLVVAVLGLISSVAFFALAP
ncbi:NUDIX hydrolase [Micromonospora sp. NPDC049523]|uniref:NUDIX hydrolase n=1 Tax=Micromonospora sp. NPDC049523 TaxID=3155921 RepID=UPI00342313BF